MQTVPAGSGVMTAPEILISLHSIDTAKDGVPLKRVMVGLDACMKEDQRQAFPPESMAVALQQLVTRLTCHSITAYTSWSRAWSLEPDCCNRSQSSASIWGAHS